MGSRLRAFATLISIFALIGQMLLPVAHAASMARQSGDPLAYAFCGHVSELSLQQFRDSAPPELLAWLKKSDLHEKASPKPGCDLCASFHANHLAGPPTLALSLLRSVAVLDQAVPAIDNEPIALVVLPQLRAPPSLA